MKIALPNQHIQFAKHLFSMALLWALWINPFQLEAQNLELKLNPDTCDCEKVVWKIKVKVDGKLKTYVRTLNKKELNPDAFPEREKLQQFTFRSDYIVVILPEAPSQVDITATLAENKIWFQPDINCSAPEDFIILEDEETDFELVNMTALNPESEGSGSMVSRPYPHTNKYVHSGKYQVNSASVGGASWYLKPMLSIKNKIPECYSARCYMRLNVLIRWGEISPGLEASPELLAAGPTYSQEDLIMTAYGTGNTSGTVMSVEISNPTDQTIPYLIEPGIVPHTGNHQGYVFLDEISGSVAPGETISKPVEGWCDDIHFSAVTAGKKTAPIHTWIPASDMSDPIQPGFTPPPGSAFELVEDHPGIEDIGGVPVSGTYCTYMGTDSLFDYTIDIKDNTEEVAPLLYESIHRITAIYDSLYDEGLINTPFSFDPVKEKTSVIQTTYWEFTSFLEGDPYTYEQFEEKLIKQYEDNTGIDYKNAQPEAKEELESGGKQYWTTCNVVGNQAKILRTIDSSPEFIGYCNISGLGVLSVTGADVCDAIGGIYFFNKEEADAYDGPTRDTFPVGLKKVTTSLGKGGQITIGGQVSGQIDSVDRIIILVSNEVEAEYKVKVDPETGKFEVVIHGVHDGEYKITVEAVMKGDKASYGLTHGRIIVVTDEESTNKGSTIAVNGQTVKVVDVDEEGNVIIEFAGNQHTLKKGESLDVESGIITVSEVDTETDAVTFEIKKKKCCGEVPVEEDESIPYTEYGREDLSDEEKEKLGLSGYRGVILPPNIAQDVPETVIAILPFTALPPFGYRCLSHYWLFNQQADDIARGICYLMVDPLFQDIQDHNRPIPEEERSRRIILGERLQINAIFDELSLPPDRFEQCVKGELYNLDYVIDGVVGFRCCPLPNDREGVRPFFEAFIVDAKDKTGKKLDSVIHYSPICLDPNSPDVWNKIQVEAKIFQEKVNEMARNFISGL